MSYKFENDNFSLGLSSFRELTAHEIVCVGGGYAGDYNDWAGEQPYNDFSAPPSDTQVAHWSDPRGWALGEFINWTLGQFPGAVREGLPAAPSTTNPAQGTSPSTPSTGNQTFTISSLGSYDGANGYGSSNGYSGNDLSN